MKAVFAVVIFLVLCSPATFAYNDIPDSGPVAELHAKAKAGDADAQFNLAEAYRDGESVRKDMQEALKWYHRSATQGNTEAQFALGFAYRGGDGVQMNKVLSYMWFDIASKNGEESAFGLRNDVAWSMTEPEIDEARNKAQAWKPNQKNDDGFVDGDEDN